MDKETKILVIILFTITLLSNYVMWKSAENYYTGLYETELKSAEQAYYQAIFERDTYAYMYYKEIGNEEMAKTFEKSNIFERKNEWLILENRL